MLKINNDCYFNRLKKCKNSRKEPQTVFARYKIKLNIIFIRRAVSKI